MKAYDLLIQAETGLASITGRPEGPGRVGISVCDVSCGMNAHAAVLEALLDRTRTGKGASIKVSLFDSVADWMNVPLLYSEGTGFQPARMGLAHPTLAPYGAFASADGIDVVVSIQNEREWQRFCEIVLSQGDLALTPGYDSSSARVANRAEVDTAVAQVFAALSIAELERRLNAAGTAFGRVNDVFGLARHPALRRVPVIVPGGSVQMIAPPAIFDRVTPQLGEVPGLGAQSAAIRQEFSQSLVKKVQAHA